MEQPLQHIDYNETRRLHNRSTTLFFRVLDGAVTVLTHTSAGSN